MMKGPDNPFSNFYICTQEKLLVNYVMSAGQHLRLPSDMNGQYRDDL